MTHYTEVYVRTFVTEQYYTVPYIFHKHPDA